MGIHLEEGVDEIKYQKQRFDYDCGHTCLDMLGYDGHGIFESPKGLSDEWIMACIPNVQGVDPSLARNDNFESPHLLIIETRSGYHCVLAYGDKIYCPQTGVWEASEFPSRLETRAMLQIPFAKDNETHLIPSSR